MKSCFMPLFFKLKMMAHLIFPSKSLWDHGAWTGAALYKQCYVVLIEETQTQYICMCVYICCICIHIETELLEGNFV